MEKESFVIRCDEPPATILTKTYERFVPPLLDVYLASALTGRTKTQQGTDSLHRKKIVEVMEGYDYMGLLCKVYDPSTATPPKSKHSSEDVYIIDQDHTANADLVVFYLNSPSFGIGMEAQIAADASVPRVIIRPYGVPISRMIRGVFNPTLFDIQYKNVEALEKQLSEAMGNIMGELYECTPKRRDVISKVLGCNLPKFIFCQRILKNITLKEISDKTGIQPYWIGEMERDARKCSTLTIIQLELIADVLDSVLEIGEEGKFCMKSKEYKLSDPVKKSLRNLHEFVLSQTKATEELILREWANYYEKDVSPVKEAARGNLKELTVADWKKRFDKPTLFNL